MPSCNIRLAARRSGHFSGSCTFVSSKDVTGIKWDITPSCPARKKNVSTSLSSRLPPHARYYATSPRPIDSFYRVGTGSYTRTEHLGRRRIRDTSKTPWLQVSSLYFCCSMLYLVLHGYTTQQTLSASIVIPHPPCRSPGQHIEKRSAFCTPSPRSRNAPSPCYPSVRKSAHLPLCHFSKWKCKGVHFLLPGATQPSHTCCPPRQHRDVTECRNKRLKCPLRREIYRGKPAKYRRNYIVKKAVSFLLFPTKTHLVAQQSGQRSRPLLLFVSPGQSHLCATASPASATDQHSHDQGAIQQEQTAEIQNKEVSARAASVPGRVQGQFPFAYNGDPYDVRKAVSNGPHERGDKPPLPDNKKQSFVYFDNAATTQKPWGVLQALQRAYIHENANVHRSTYSRAAVATERLEGVRSQLAKYLNAEQPEEIVFTSGATDSINLVAGSWGSANISEGDEIVLSIAEHHSNVIPWQLLATQKKAFIKYIQLDEQHLLSISSLISLLSPRTKLVALSHTSNVLGTFNPYVREVVRVIKQFDPSIIVLLDASQALAHQKLDVRDLSCDFLAGSGHKMYGPTGVGFLYGKHNLLQEMPPWKGGGEMIAEVFRNASTYADPPARFEAGTPPFVQIAGLGAALGFIEQVGLREIMAYELKLHNLLLSALEAYVPALRLFCPPAFPSPPPQLASTVCSSDSSRKLEPLPPVPLVSFVHPFVHAQDIATFLDVCDGIYIRSGHQCCQLLHREALRVPATCRASLAVYNTEEEVTRFVKSVQSVITMLERQRLDISHAAPDADQIPSSKVLPQAEMLSVHSEYGMNLLR